MQKSVKGLRMKTFLFYFFSLTWGLPMTLFGALTALALVIFGHKPKLWRGCIYFEVGKSWGGLEMGLFFLVHRGASAHLKNHEFGHGIQNCILGPLMPFLVSVPSAIRYWYRKFREPQTEYDSIWFERWASRLGEEKK